MIHSPVQPDSASSPSKVEEERRRQLLEQEEQQSKNKPDEELDEEDGGDDSDDSEEEDEEEEEQLNFRDTKRFRTWRKHTRDIYKLCMHFEPTWPCRTIQFLPHMTLDPHDPQHKTQTLLAGTTTGEQEQSFLKLMKLDLPSGLHPPPSCSAVDPELGEVGGYGSAPRYLNFSVSARFFHDGDVIRARYMPSNPNVFLTASTNGNLYLFDNSALSHSDPPNYPKRPVLPPPPSEPETSPKYEQLMNVYRRKIHEQEDWDRKTKGPGQHKVILKPGDEVINCDMNNRNNVDDASTLSTSKVLPTSCEWNPHEKKGLLAAGFTNGVVAEWSLDSADMSSGSESTTGGAVAPTKKTGASSKQVIEVKPTTIRVCTAGVRDVQYSSLDANALAAACEDGATRIWDLRSSSAPSQPAVVFAAPKLSPTAASTTANNGDDDKKKQRNSGGGNKNAKRPMEATCLAWSLFDENQCAVGYSTGSTRIWDRRKPSVPVCAFRSHRANTEVLSLQWNPHDPAVLATGGEDANVVWVDVEKHKCLFVHSGHTKAVEDMCWSWQDTFAGQMVSVDDTPSIIAWSPRVFLLDD